MTADFQAQGAQRNRAYPAQLTTLTLRGAGQMFDMQLTTLRTLFETQARAAAAFGFPDCSALFKNGAEDSVRQAISSGTEQLINTTQRAGEVVGELQQQVGRIVESQAHTAAQTWQQGIEQLGSQTDESLQQLSRTAQQQAEQLERSSAEAGDAMQQSLRQGGEQMRQQLQDGAQRGRETLAQAGDSQRQQTESTVKAAQGGEEKSKRERAA